MSFYTDVKFAARSLARVKGLATTVILTLALGIGANAAIFQAWCAASCCGRSSTRMRNTSSTSARVRSALAATTSSFRCRKSGI